MLNFMEGLESVFMQVSDIGGSSNPDIRGTLRLERIRLRMTQAEAAARLGCSRKRICEFELGLTDPALSFVLSYAQVLGRDLNLGERPEPSTDFVTDIVDN